MRSAPRKLSKTAKPCCSSARSAECAEKRACVGAQSVRSDGAAAASSALWTPVAALNVCLGAVPYSVRSRVEGAAAPGALDAMPGRPMRCWWHSCGDLAASTKCDEPSHVDLQSILAICQARIKGWGSFVSEWE